MTNDPMKKELMIRNVKIDSIDKRGWYIVSGGTNGGVDYLYSDGIIREGVLSKDPGAFGFWPTEEAARLFFQKWKGEADEEFWDGLGMT